MENNIVSNQLIEKIESLLKLARTKVAVQVNNTLLLTYMEIGKVIVHCLQRLCAATGRMDGTDHGTGGTGVCFEGIRERQQWRTAYRQDV